MVGPWYPWAWHLRIPSPADAEPILRESLRHNQKSVSVASGWYSGAQGSLRPPPWVSLPFQKASRVGPETTSGCVSKYFEVCRAPQGRLWVQQASGELGVALIVIPWPCPPLQTLTSVDFGICRGVCVHVLEWIPADIEGPLYLE